VGQGRKEKAEGACLEVLKTNISSYLSTSHHSSTGCVVDHDHSLLVAKLVCVFSFRISERVSILLPVRQNHKKRRLAQIIGSSVFCFANVMCDRPI